MLKGFSMRENRPTSSVEEFVNSKINWEQIEDQIVVKETGNRYFAHVFFFVKSDWRNSSESC